VYAVIGAITGAVYDKGLPNPNEGYPCGLLYQRDSNLFVVEHYDTVEVRTEPLCLARFTIRPDMTAWPQGDWGLAMTHSWKIIGGAFLAVAYVISAYQILRSLIRPRLGETFRWLLPRAFFCLLAFCVFMYWIVEGEWLKYKDDLRNHSVQNTSSPRR
jgi:hypothetical protein